MKYYVVTEEWLKRLNVYPTASDGPIELSEWLKSDLSVRAIGEIAFSALQSIQRKDRPQ